MDPALYHLYALAVVEEPAYRILQNTIQYRTCACILQNKIQYRTNSDIYVGALGGHLMSILYVCNAYLYPDGYNTLLLNGKSLLPCI
eukprot:12423694-Ditylum_brightwellii.AAC.1